MSLLAEAAIFLAAAVITVPLFRRFKLGAVLGYLAAGVIIGPWGLELVDQVEGTMHFAELGVVLLLFVIGLELQPSRLWVLRKPILGLGSAQVLATGAVLGLIGYAAFGLPWRSALVTGVGLAMSSTALVLQVLAERNQLSTRHGRSAFAILLFQDLAVIPLLALIPLLATSTVAAAQPEHNAWLGAVKAVAVIIAVVIGGRFLLRPAFRAIARSRTQEIFTAAALLVVIGVSLLMTGVGLSMSLGAFLAGVLLADSEYRHELEANIEPFKGLLLGLFFISVGMGADIGLLLRHPFAILAAAIGLVAVKALVLYAISRLAGHGGDAARNLAASLAQGGEFAFVLFGVAAAHQIMGRALTDALIVIVTLSMALTPLVLMLGDRQARRRPPQTPAFDYIDGAEARVIIAGFGRVGGVIGRLLRAKKIPFTALDLNPEQVELVRKFGAKAHYGDASRLELLVAAGAAKAQVLVLALDDVEKSLLTAETARRHFPHLRIYARARNRFHAYRLMDLEGVHLISRETFASSLELAAQVLKGVGLSDWEARDVVEKFKRQDELMLVQQHAVYHDETQLIQTTREASREMEALLESDSEQVREGDLGAPFSPADVR